MSPTTPHHSGKVSARPWLKWCLALAAVAALGGIFALYSRPDFVLDMANRLWACF